jgi:hypothetical protein
MTRDCYCSFLTKLVTKIVETRYGKLFEGALFLQDNTPACCPAKNLIKLVLKLPIIEHILLTWPFRTIFNTQESLKRIVKTDGDGCSRHVCRPRFFFTNT